MLNVIKWTATAFLASGAALIVGCTHHGPGVPTSVNCANPINAGNAACMAGYSNGGPGYPGSPGVGTFMPGLDGDGRVVLQITNPDAISHWALYNGICQVSPTFDCLGIVSAELSFHLESSDSHYRYRRVVGHARWRIYFTDRNGQRVASSVYEGRAFRTPGGFQIHSDRTLITGVDQGEGNIALTISFRYGPQVLQIGSGNLRRL